MRLNSFISARIFIFLTLAFLLDGCNNTPRKAPYIIAKSKSDIIPIDNLENVPLVLYDNRIDLNQFSIDEKKHLFISLLLPSVLAARGLYQEKHDFVSDLLEEYEDISDMPAGIKQQLDALTSDYKAKDYDDLASRLKPNPTSIIIAQAAIESGWGTSRMFIEANNVFGVWSFDKSEPRIRARGTRASGPVYLRKYPSIFSSVADHFKLFATVRAYEKFRNERSREIDALNLIPYLSVYSEQRHVYVEKLRNVILQNDLEKYDSAILDGSYDMSAVN